MLTHYKVKDKINLTIDSFKSSTELVNTLNVLPYKGGNWHDMKTTKYSKNFEGCRDYIEAVALLAQGWEKPVKSLNKVYEEVRLKGVGKRVTFYNHVVGFQPVIPLALLNVPNCMVTTNIKSVEGRIIDIYYDSSVHCGISSEQVLEAGKKLLSVIISLEQQGYRINFYCVTGYAEDKNSETYMVQIKIKDSRQPINLQKFAFYTCHSAFQRVIGFDWYSKALHTRYYSGYGRPPSRELGIQTMKDTFVDLYTANSIYVSTMECIDNDEAYIEKMLITPVKTKPIKNRQIKKTYNSVDERYIPS